MAKRRNLRKEKAERNKAYARKFRKTSRGKRFSDNRFKGNKTGAPKSENNGTSAAEDSSV